MYVCLCVGVTAQQVIDAVQAGAVTTREVGERTGAGTVCGRCKNNVRTLIKATLQDSKTLT